jgi:hypothetical protein
VGEGKFDGIKVYPSNTWYWQFKQKRVFLLPSLTDFERYIITNDAIIIRLLISELPLQLV